MTVTSKIMYKASTYSVGKIQLLSRDFVDADIKVILNK